MQNIYLTIYRQINMAVDPFFVYSLLSVNNQKYIYIKNSNIQLIYLHKTREI